MPLDSKEFRNVLGLFATGVTVLTSKDKDGKGSGITANAFTSVSLDPPLVLICIDKNAQCYGCFEESKVFVVNILAQNQEEISRRFATKGIDKFEGVSWHAGLSGVPLIDGAVGYIECKVVQGYEGGDHTIYLGEVLNVVALRDDPLLFFKGKYYKLGPA
jgi:3-hydroxy-9,10-secoandrosta-1,3,5(10)-triene-9,17-dione monooxygenase reductase component